MNRLVILNPTARLASRCEALIEEIGADPGTEVVRTSGRGDASGLARRGREEGASEIVSAGGDGTLNEVVNGLAPFAGAKSRPPPTVGLLPLGTGNDAARSLGVPLDLREARSVLDRGTTRRVDVGHVTGERDRYFVNSVIGGVGGLVERRLTGRLKRWLGRYSYLFAAVSALRRPTRHRVRLEWAEGEQSMEMSALSVIVANGSFAGAGIPVAPGARVDDGRLDAVVIEAGAARRIPGLVADVLRGRHIGRDDVRHVRASSLSVQARPPMWASLDGEVLGDEELELSVIPGALRVRAASGGGANRGMEV